MKHVGNVDAKTQDSVITSLESTLHKLLKSFDSVKRRGGNTHLITRRLHAVQVGLKSIVSLWNDKSFDYTGECVASVIVILHGIRISIEKQLKKAKEGSAQKTLNVRRHLALTLVIESLEDRL